MFSKACKYGIRAVLYLAVHASEEKKLGAKEVADALDVPKPFLAKILQQLSRQHLISSSKGMGGGFFLNEANNANTLSAVIESIDGGEVFSSCILGFPICSSDDPCPLHAKSTIYKDGLLELIDHQSIKQFADKIRIQKRSI